MSNVRIVECSDTGCRSVDRYAKFIDVKIGDYFLFKSDAPEWNERYLFQKTKVDEFRSVNGENPGEVFSKMLTEGVTDCEVMTVEKLQTMLSFAVTHIEWLNRCKRELYLDQPKQSVK